jgi:phage major head subunit gpT-like protein
MLAITRKDIINDDLGALTAVPRRLGRGGALKLNDVFWTVFLNNTSFFASGNSNVNTGVADMTIGGLEATEVIFLDQTDPDSKPLGVQPKILLVPTALKAAALALMTSERIIDGSSTGRQGDANIYRGRFRVESSPYMSNSAYTGYSAAAWYMLADPNEMPVVEIAALNGRVEPVVETADADFNVLGVQMRGYSDVGVALQEYRGGVRADGGAS